MDGATLWGLGGVFLGGALPWLEAVVVIPAGILAGLPPAATIIAGAVGNVITVGIAAFWGERLRARWRAWRARRRALRGGDAVTAISADTGVRHGGEPPSRIERVFRRGGLPLLALVGPLGVGTQASALIAVALGTPATRAFTWIAGGTVLWCVVAGVAAVSGVQLFVG